MSLNLEHNSGLTFCATLVLPAVATTTTSFKTTNAATYSIGGIFYTKAATDNIAFSAATGAIALPSLAIGQSVACAIVADSSGNVKVAFGPTVNNTESCPIPFAPPGYAIIGAIKISGTTAVFVPNTTVLGTGHTVTYYSLSDHPGISL